MTSDYAAGKEKIFDLYYHPGQYETVIARFGKHGDYYSGMTFAQPYVELGGELRPGIPMLVEARRRAVARGLLPHQPRGDDLVKTDACDLSVSAEGVPASNGANHPINDDESARTALARATGESQ